MEPRLLRSFVAVAEELHFGRAARRLHISQPPLSMQIKRLEAELGVRLLERSHRHVALTEAGATLLGRARHLLAESARTCAEVQRTAAGESGVLAVAYTPTATYELLPRAVPRFRAARPGVRLELVELRSSAIPDALRDGRAEVGLVCAPVPSDGLTTRTLVEESLVVALPSRHPLARRRRIHVSRLRDQPFVLVDPTVEPAWAGASARALARAGLTPDIVQLTDSKIALLGLIAANLGVSVVSRSMTALTRRGVTFRPLDGLTLALPLALLTLPSPSPRATTFANCLR